MTERPVTQLMGQHSQNLLLVAALHNLGRESSSQLQAMSLAMFLPAYHCQ